MLTLGAWYLVVMLFRGNGASSDTAVSFTVPFRTEKACMDAAKYYEKRFHGTIISCVNTTNGNVREQE